MFTCRANMVWSTPTYFCLLNWHLNNHFTLREQIRSFMQKGLWHVLYTYACKSSFSTAGKLLTATTLSPMTNTYTHPHTHVSTTCRHFTMLDFSAPTNNLTHTPHVCDCAHLRVYVTHIHGRLHKYAILLTWSYSHCKTQDTRGKCRPSCFWLKSEILMLRRRWQTRNDALRIHQLTTSMKYTKNFVPAHLCLSNKPAY